MNKAEQILEALSELDESVDHRMVLPSDRNDREGQFVDLKHKLDSNRTTSKSSSHHKSHVDGKKVYYHSDERGRIVVRGSHSDLKSIQKDWVHPDHHVAIVSKKLS